MLATVNKTKPLIVRLNPVNKLLDAIKSRYQINKSCKQLEQRTIRQNALYCAYINNVKITNNMINIKGLYDNYLFDPLTVLLSLYKYGSKFRVDKPCNIFGLPLEKIIGQDVHSPRENKSIEERIENLLTIHENKLLDYPKGKDDIYRVFLKRNRLCFFVKDHNYDFTTITPEILSNHVVDTITLIERKKLLEQLNPINIEEVLKISSKFNNHINKICNIDIKNTFDGSHIYNMKTFNNHYPNNWNAFNFALLSELRSRLNFVGDSSIEYEKTISLIKQSVRIITKSDDLLARELYSDFVNCSTHSTFDRYVDVGKLMDLYNIEAYELLHAMYKYADAKRDSSSFSFEDAIKILEEPQCQHLRHITCINGRQIQNSFRKNREQQQIISAGVYDDFTHPGNFYECFIWLMASKHKSSEYLSETRMKYLC